MSAPSASQDLLNALEEQLKANAKGREDFDMDDTTELVSLKPFPLLEKAIISLDGELTVRWRKADTDANHYQKRHQWLSRIAVVTGVVAIILAIVQLALDVSCLDHKLSRDAVWLEKLFCVVSIISVAAGLYAKFNHKWLGHRHVAERLRMLKFSSLAHPSLWREDQAVSEEWLNSIEDEIEKISSYGKYKGMKKWSKDDVSEAKVPKIGKIGVAPQVRRALVLYYRYKRLQYQGEYFQKMGEKAGKSRAVRLRHWRGAIFLASTGFVLIHFLTDIAPNTLPKFNLPPFKSTFEFISIWGAAIAAILPVASMGVRAWSAVFELSRKARCFEAKHRAMDSADKTLDEDKDEPLEILSHIRFNEFFLEQEHREWLRLQLEAEWFV